MQLGDAKAAARRWVQEHGSAIPGFAGAFFHGSAVGRPDHALLPASSDLDVMLVVSGVPPLKPGKFIHEGVLLEVSLLAAEALASPEQVLGQYQIAGSFRAPEVIADPTGHLTRLQAAVARDFARRRWVQVRCSQARDRVLLAARPAGDTPLPEQVIAWLFPTGILTHVLLVAALRNPTVRRRYQAVRDVLIDYQHFDLHAPLLAALGCAHWTAGQTTAHLNAITEAFDDAASVLRTPVFFASDLSAAARPIAIDGSRELIATGLHREAVFWIAATACRCQIVLAQDAPPDLHERHLPAFLRLLADLGVATTADREQRWAATLALVPRVWSVAEAIIAANREIVD